MSQTKVIAVLSQKGGAGKTFTTVNLAGTLDGTVAIIDTDPQGSSDRWSKRRASNNVSKMPYTTKGDIEDLPVLISNARKNSVDWLLIDTRGTTGPEMVDIARMADIVMVPSKITGVDIDAVRATVKLLRVPHMPPHFIVLTCVRKSLIGISLRAHRAADAIRKAGGHLAPVQISDLIAFSDAFDTGRTVRETNPGSKGDKEITTLAEFTQTVLV